MKMKMCNSVYYHIQMRNRTKKTLNTESKGEVTIEGEYGTLKFER